MGITGRDKLFKSVTVASTQKKGNGISADMAQNEMILRGSAPQQQKIITVGDMLRASAKRAPEHIFLKEKKSDQIHTITFSQILCEAGRIGRTLSAFGLSKDKTLAILSHNSIKHATYSLAAMLAGIPVAPISVAYSQISDETRLSQIFEILEPGLVYAENEHDFAKGIALAKKYQIATLTDARIEQTRADYTTDELVHKYYRPDEAFSASFENITPDTIAKILFTSGSTGMPKGVMVTHRMICTNQEALAELWPFLNDEPPIIVDWLPWNHIYGGNLVFNCALHNAGTLVIDAGKPVAGLFDETIKNLTENPPTIHFGVPRGFEELVVRLKQDEKFAKIYFSKLKKMFTAGAALPDAVWRDYRELSKRYGRSDFQIHIGWGATETSPLATICPASNTLPNNIGIPIPGAEIKMVPNEEKLELRVRGPMVMPGYWKRPDLTAEVFDEDGFYKIGDAGKLADEDDWTKGILFDGRTAENFKLITGTWVQVGALRLSAIEAARPLIQDAAVTGHDRDEVGLLIFLNLDACREFVGEPHAQLSALSCNSELKHELAKRLITLQAHGSSSRIGRAFILEDMPSLETGEMTDKGYLNQRAVLRARADKVEKLYSDQDDSAIIHISGH